MRTLGTLALASVIVGAQSPTPPVNVPNILVSGIGAQASAHYVNSVGVVTDVTIVLNASVAGDAATSPTMTIFISQVSNKGTGAEIFKGSAVTQDVSQEFSSDLTSARLRGTVDVARSSGTADASSLKTTVDLTWSATGERQDVMGSDYFSQPGKSVTQSLNAGLRPATVSGSILVGSDLIALSQTNVTMSLWDTTNGRNTDAVSTQATADSKHAAIARDTSSSCTGTWSGYWTWDPVKLQWFWTWVWQDCNGGARVAS